MNSFFNEIVKKICRISKTKESDFKKTVWVVVATEFLILVGLVFLILASK